MLNLLVKVNSHVCSAEGNIILYCTLNREVSNPAVTKSDAMLTPFLAVKDTHRYSPYHVTLGTRANR